MLTGRDLEIFNTIVSGWEEHGRLPGPMNYQEVIDFIARMGGDAPQDLIDRLDALQRINDRERQGVMARPSQAKLN